MNLSKKIILSVYFTLVFTLCFYAAYAVDRSPQYDYSGFNNNISAINNGAVYNTSLVGVNGEAGYTFDGVNDYLTITPNASSLCSYTTTTPWTVTIKYYQREIKTGAGQIMFRMCHDATGNGSGYLFGISTNNRFVVQNGSSFIISSNATMNNTLNEITFVTYQYYGNNTLAMIHNGSTVFNSSMTGMNANISVTDNTTIGAQNAGAQQFNGTVFEIQVHFRALTRNELEQQWNGTTSGLMPANNTNLTAYYNFDNTTSASLVINDNTPIRSNPNTFIGAQGSPSPLGAPQWCATKANNASYSVACNQDEYLLFFNASNKFGSGLDRWRVPIDWSNMIASMNTNLTANWNRITGAGQNFKNINIQIDRLIKAANMSSFIVWGIDDMALQLADNTSDCFYGLSSTGPTVTAPENQQKCTPIWNNNYTLGAEIMVNFTAQFLVDVGCFNYTADVCALEWFNEFYLNEFMWGNTTAVPESGSCVVRSGKMNDLYSVYNPGAVKAILTARGYNASRIRFYAGPSFWNDNTCAQAMDKNWSSVYPYGQGNHSTDLKTYHTYPYGEAGATAVASWITDFQMNQANSSMGNYTNAWWVSEGDITDTTEVTTNTTQYQSDITTAMMFLANSTNSSGFSIYKDSSITTSQAETAPYIMFRESNLTYQQTDGSVSVYNNTLTGAYYLVRTYMTIPDGTTLYPITSSDGSVKALYYRYNATLGYVWVNNWKTTALDIDSISLASSTNITSVKKLVQGLGQRINLSETASAGAANPNWMSAYGSTIYELTLGATNISATYTPSTYIVNITEPNNQTFSLSLTNPSNQTYSIVWQNSTGGTPIVACSNMTSCTQAGSYSSAGQYNWTVTITGETNTLIKVWLLQINQTNQNISASYSPSQNQSIVVGASLQFSATLTNPDSVPYTVTWFSNGVNTTSCYNSTSCSYTGATVGSNNISLQVVAPTNTLTNDWNLTVTAGTTSTICASNSEGALMFSRFSGTIGMILVLAVLILLILGAMGNISFTGISAPAIATTVIIFVVFLIISVVAVTLVSSSC